MKIFISILTIFYLQSSYPAEITNRCSRVALIEGKKVLIDGNSGTKGDGLKIYIQNDLEAMKYFEEYQNNNKIQVRNLILGTTGTVLLIGGILFAKNKKTKNTFLVGGAAATITNILANTTFRFYNEENLNRAISIYNKRNNPKITLINDNFNSEDRRKGEIYFEKTWSF